MGLRVGIYQNLPEHEREKLLEARRKVKAHVISLDDLKRHQQRYGESSQVEGLRSKAELLRDEAMAELDLLELRLNTEYAALASSVRGRKPKKSER